MLWSTTPRPPGSAERVLVVDRGEDAALSQTTLLQLQGFDARAACTGRSALSLASEGDPDVVLLDLDLDDASPFDVIRSLRGAKQPPNVVILTAHTSAASRQAASDAGAAAFVLKPADPQGLAELLRSLGRDQLPPAALAAT